MGADGECMGMIQAASVWWMEWQYDPISPVVQLTVPAIAHHTRYAALCVLACHRILTNGEEIERGMRQVVKRRGHGTVSVMCSSNALQRQREE